MNKKGFIFMQIIDKNEFIMDFRFKCENNYQKIYEENVN